MGPNWFDTLSKEMQIRLFADYRLAHTPQKKKSKKRIDPKELQKRIDAYKSRGAT